ncbi:SpaA isopeptide-forming pilin-related protein [Enterococcus sp. LJL98]
MRKKGMIWFTFILLLASFIPNLMQAYVVNAQSANENHQTVIETDELSVSTVVRQVDEQFHWEIKYQLDVSEENTTKRPKFKLFNGDADTDANLVAPQEIQGWGYSQDNWFMPEGLSTSSEGTIVVTTDLSVQHLNLRVQIDEEVTHKIEVEKTIEGAAAQTTATTDLALSEEAEMAQAPPTETIIETVEETIVTENILEAPDSNTHQLSAPKVTSEVDQTNKKPNVVEQSQEETEPPISSEEESSPSDTRSEEGSGELDRPITFPNPYASRMAAFPTVSPGLLSTEITNGFEYTTNEFGRFPTHGTDPVGNSTDPVNNFNFGVQVPSGTTPVVENILSGGLTFEGGYHSYDLSNFPTNALLKKTVKPTANPTEFEITLDVIGATNRTVNNIDVVFVIDKSGSMNSENRWAKLKTELAKFSKALIESSFEEDNIRMGLVAFDDLKTSNPTRYTSRARIADFSSGNSTTSITGFTSDYNRFDATKTNGHYLLKNDDPEGGTPLFLGIDAGLELLTKESFGARSDARKVLIVLSDGIATYAPTQMYLNNGLNSLAKTKQNNSIQYLTNTTGGTWPNQTNTHVIGDGQETDINLLPPNQSNSNRRNVINLTNNFITSRRSSSYLPISIGLGLSGDYVNQAKGILRNFAGGSITNPNDPGNFFDTAVDDLDDALDKVRTLILTLHDMIRDGTITDPMSQFVELIGGTVKTFALTLNTGTHSLTATPALYANGTMNAGAPQYAKNAVLDQTSNPLTVTNLYLSGQDDLRYGYRIVYTVELKEAYQDGLFYPANGRTTLTATNIADPLDFAIPSVRYKQSINLPVEKIWIDDNNSWQTRQDITLQLQKQTGGTWVDVTGQSFAIAKTATGNDLKHTFSNLPAYQNGTPIQYRIVETPTRVNGYKKAVYTPASIQANVANPSLKVTNELAVLKLGKFTKINAAGDGLQGVKFKLFRADGTTQIGTEKTSTASGEVDFSDLSLPVGTYILKETTTLPGYQPMADRTLTITDSETTEVNLVLSGMDDRPNQNGNQIVNQLKPFDLKVTKEDSHGNALEGAEFSLTPVTEGMTATVDDNLFTFAGLKPGTYTLTETKVPNGYLGIEPLTLVIDSQGKVTIDNVLHAVETDGTHNVIRLTVKNRGKGTLPSTGGHGTQQYLVATIVLGSLLGLVGAYYLYRNRKEAK